MFVGHVGAALALGTAEPRVSLGVLCLASLLLDLLLWVFVLLGIESAVVPADFARRHYLTFAFPYSHGLAASVAWSLLGGIAAWAAIGRASAVLVGAAVFSHFPLDALVHVPELPLLGAGSPRLGLGLWNHMHAELALELALAGVALVLYLSVRPVPALRAAALVGLVTIAAGMTVAGNSLGQAPREPTAPAVPAIFSCLAVALAGWWIDRPAGRRG